MVEEFALIVETNRRSTAAVGINISGSIVGHALSVANELGDKDASYLYCIITSSVYRNTRPMPRYTISSRSIHLLRQSLQEAFKNSTDNLSMDSHVLSDSTFFHWLLSFHKRIKKFLD